MCEPTAAGLQRPDQLYIWEGLVWTQSCQGLNQDLSLQRIFNGVNSSPLEATYPLRPNEAGEGPVGLVKNTSFLASNNIIWIRKKRIMKTSPSRKWLDRRHSSSTASSSEKCYKPCRRVSQFETQQEADSSTDMSFSSGQYVCTTNGSVPIN